MNGDPLLTGTSSSFPNLNSSSVPTVWEEDMVQAAEQGIGCAAGPMLRLTKTSTDQQFLPGGALNPCREFSPTPETLVVENRRVDSGVTSELAAGRIATGPAGGHFIGGVPGTPERAPVPGLGVLAVGFPGPGIIGESSSGDVGVHGFSRGQAVRGDGGTFGVVGNAATQGVNGTGTGAVSFGVVGRGMSTGVDGRGTGAGTFGIVGVGGVAGVWGGDSRSGGIGVVGVSGPAIAGGITPWAGRFDGGVQVGGNLFVTGGLFVSGSPKSSVVPHPDGSQRVMYAVEAAESWLEDVGRARLRHGAARVEIDPDFAAVSGLGDDYHVFLTPEGPSNPLYVADRTPTGFEVREQGEGTSDISFSYRVVTKRAAINSGRLEPIELPSDAGEKAPGAPAELPPHSIPASPEQPGSASPGEPLLEGAVPERPSGWPETVPWPPEILVNHVRR